MIPLWAYPVGLGVRLLALMVGHVQHGGVSEVFHSTQGLSLRIVAWTDHRKMFEKRKWLGN